MWVLDGLWSLVLGGRWLLLLVLLLVQLLRIPHGAGRQRRVIHRQAGDEGAAAAALAGIMQL